MHFSKTYSQLLLGLPPELRDNAIQYRELKKLINQVVDELASIGLSPTVLQELLAQSDSNSKHSDGCAEGKESREALTGDASSAPQPHPRVVYEFNNDSARIEPRLRLWLDANQNGDASFPRIRAIALDEPQESDSSDLGQGGDQPSLLWQLQRRTGHREVAVNLLSQEAHDVTGSSVHEVVIPLASDTAFFRLLSTALRSLSAQLLTVHSQFISTLEGLAKDISLVARPVSETSAFQPYSPLTSKPEAIHISYLPALSFGRTKSDLDTWRQIFQLYIESEVFENVGEVHRGERSVQESEERLQAFANRVTSRGLGDGRRLKLRQSREALETFLELNIFILNVKKFQLANAEATRKILKKHAKRTALHLPPSPTAEIDLQMAVTHPPQSLSDLAFIPQTFTSLPHILVQAIGEILLPIIPHLDDYSCLICYNIAFKPIRLICGHLFCVRCLVKMQKRGQQNCPMCRAPTVLVADRTNVDWALLNFMKDWFPTESRLKLRQNEREASEEQLRELGIDPHPGCSVM